MGSAQSDSSTPAILLKLLVFTLLVPGTVTVWLPFFVLFPQIRQHPPVWNPLSFVGVFLIVSGAAGYSWCALDFAFAGRGTPAPIDPPKELVVRGLYKYSRNPMYISVFTVLVGESLMFRSPALLQYAATVGIFFHLFVVFYEEPTLRRNMNGAYTRYCAEVPRWFFPPRRKPKINAI